MGKKQKIIFEKKVQRLHLTPCEVRISECVAVGMSRKGMMDQLAMSWHAVDFHLRNIFKKTQSHSLSRVVFFLLN